MRILFIKKRIIGEIVYSQDIGKVLKRWRSIFKVSQKDLSTNMNISPSVISDYENNRRLNPGIHFLKNFVDVIVDIDAKENYKTIDNLETICKLSIPLNVLVDLSFFKSKISFLDLVKHTRGQVLNSSEIQNNELTGYVIIDEFEFILKLNIDDFSLLNKWLPNRVLVLSNINTGRTSLTAMKLKGIKPGAVVLHNIAKTDPFAIKLAQEENINLISCQTKTMVMLQKTLRSL